VTLIPPRPVVGVLHPGAMGAAVGSALRPRAGAVVWAAAGRSQATSKRAELADLVGVPDVAALARRSDVVISVCPPHAARAVADEVAAALDGPLGVPLPDGANAASGTSDAPNAALAPSGGTRRPIYVDANAVSPATVRAIADRLGADRVVDAAIIGPPAWERGHTVLWLSGAAARDVAALFAGSPFDARVLGPELGTASALKACFALQSKALPAIWLELAAAARGYGVEEELRGELERHGVDLAAALRSAAGGAEKAWRWAGEMDEAADAVAAAGLPDGFSRAAAEIYRRLADGRLTP
jgi:3-hydroxyisobutyrate dehydrogenase-like beta-hydroxyacid dehydrogenase